ncbi:YkvR family protein [Leptospira santarosai]|nr:YkvR family protein [Leptospira santarosai]
MIVKVPELDLSFRGTINNYSTSRTDFTDENSSSLFSLELIEIG